MTDYRPFEPRPQTPGFIYYEPPTGEPQLSNELRVHVFDHGLLRIWARHADRPNYNRTDSAIVDVFPEHAAEFVARLTEALGIDNDRAALAAEVARLREQVRVTKLVGEGEKNRAAYEAMDTERRGWESRRAVENVHLAEVKRERDAALAHVRRLMANRDAVARAVRSPDLTDAEKIAEIREAFAIVEGERAEAGEGR